ncbi:hypothetical protein IWZ01DRAFT_267847 [Phyllosticta capitalensis]
MSGYEQDLKTNPPCHSRACAIQGVLVALQCLSPCLPSLLTRSDCLQRSGFQEDKCQKQVTVFASSPRCPMADRGEIDALYECCNAFYQKNGDDASCVSCPKAPLLRCVGSTNAISSIYM